MKPLHLILILLSLFLNLTGCKTSGTAKTSGYVYSIKNAEVRGSNINFTFTNHGYERIKNFSVFITFGTNSLETGVLEIPFIEKKFECCLERLESDDFEINLEDYNYPVDENNDFIDLLMAGDFYMERIYAKEITFDGDLLWCDKYGNWSF